VRLLRQLLFPLLAVLAAFLVGAVLVALIGDDPLETYQLLLGSAVSWPDGIGYTLFYATPLIFTGLAVAVWGAVPGVLKARFGAHEVITTIMMNFIAVALAGYYTQYHFKKPGDPLLQTVEIGTNARVARLGRVVPGLPERIPLNVGFLLALAACLGVYLFLWKTKWGYALRATGASPRAAEYGGISSARQVVTAMAVSGGLAGMVAINEVLGYRYRYYDGFSAGYGFTGIAVALLGRNHPAGVLVAGLFFGALLRGGLFVDIFTEHVSKDLVQVLQAVIILFVASEELFRRRLVGFGWPGRLGKGKV
jgi:ABC-type uncharacterized transport system permease subunit